MAPICPGCKKKIILPTTHAYNLTINGVATPIVALMCPHCSVTLGFVR
jgi:hypothetical protein